VYPYNIAGDGIGDTELPWKGSSSITNGGDDLPLVQYLDTYLTIWDDSDTVIVKPDEQDKFYANYSNATGAITGANCTINFTDSEGNNMGYNASS